MPARKLWDIFMDSLQGIATEWLTLAWQQKACAELQSNYITAIVLGYTLHLLELGAKWHKPNLSFLSIDPHTVCTLTMQRLPSRHASTSMHPITHCMVHKLASLLRLLSRMYGTVLSRHNEVVLLTTAFCGPNGSCELARFSIVDCCSEVRITSPSIYPASPERWEISIHDRLQSNQGAIFNSPFISSSVVALVDPTSNAAIIHARMSFRAMSTRPAMADIYCRFLECRKGLISWAPATPQMQYNTRSVSYEGTCWLANTAARHRAWAVDRSGSMWTMISRIIAYYFHNTD